jgi:pimeloyl-ACP methyl ester carboxylesterase
VTASLPAPLRATVADLPPDVARALTDPPTGTALTVDDGTRRWAALAWGEAAARPLVILHGVTSCSDAWWRLGPAIAATGRRVVAVDLPGHGRTGGWTGTHRFRETASEVAGFIRAAGLESPDLQVLGHSWGAMISAALPAIGLRPATIVLVDPPAMSGTEIRAMLDDPVERPYDDLAEATAAIRGANPAWAPGDVRAKALGLTLMDPEAARAVLLDNTVWDAGLADLADPAAAGIDVRVIRGETRAGSLLDEAHLPAVADRVGAANVATIADGPHSPMRTHPEATAVALIRALG